MKPSAALIVCLLLIASLILPVVSSVARAGDLQSLASPPTSTTWSTTAGFDTGAKASTSTATDTCENVTSPALLQLNNTGNYQGIGLTTGTSTCAAGAWGVNPSGLEVAYDMQTLNAGKMKDFSGNGRDGTLTGTSSASGKFGTGLQLSGGPHNVVSSTFTEGPNSTTAAWVKLNGANAMGHVASTLTACSFNGKGIAVEIGAAGVSTNNIDVIVEIGAAPFIGDHVSIHGLSNTFFTPVVVTLNWNSSAWSTIQIFFNGTLDKSFAVLGHIPSFTTSLAVGGGASCWTNTNPYVVDEVQFSNRVWTTNEITAFSTDGRSQFASSGTWTSPATSTPNQIPSNVLITYSGATSTRTLTFSILDDLGGTRWTWTGLITSGSSVQIPVGSPEAQSSSWEIRVTWASGGTGTATVSSLTVETTDIPPIVGGPPIFFGVRCSYNSLLLSWTCEDRSDYSRVNLSGILAITWTYDGSVVASSRPQDPVTFAALNATYLDEPRDHLLKVQAVLGGGPGPYGTVLLRTDQTFAQLVVALVLMAVLVAAIASARRMPLKDVYFAPVSNPEFKRSAISVEEYPRGWMSYRQRDPDPYHGRLRSVKQGKDRWIVYGLRPATEAERARTGRKYVAEVQTVRERIR